MRSFEEPRTLLFALLLFLLQWVAACGSSGDSTERVTVRYSGDGAAYGISIRTGTVAASTSANGTVAQAATCKASAKAMAAGCTANIGSGEGEWTLALYGCFVQPGDELFDCELPPALTEGFLANAMVSAGCGCQMICPASPSVIVCADDSVGCGKAVVTAGNSRMHAGSNVVATTSPSVGSTTCSTCCETDFYDDMIGTVSSDEPLSEVEMEVTFADECQFDFNGAAVCEAAFDYGSWGQARFSESRLVKRLCLAASGPPEVPLAVPVLSCRGLIVGAVVTRALGRDFEPLTSMPTLQFR
jgi:hypothetical protein